MYNEHIYTKINLESIFYLIPFLEKIKKQILLFITHCVES